MSRTAILRSAPDKLRINQQYGKRQSNMRCAICDGKVKRIAKGVYVHDVGDPNVNTIAREVKRGKSR